MIEWIAQPLDEGQRQAVSSASFALAGHVPPPVFLTATLECLICAAAGLAEIVWRSWTPDA